MNGYYNPSQFEDLDLPYDPLEEAPNIYELTAPYVESAREPFRAQVEPYNPWEERLAANRARLSTESQMENLKSQRLQALDQLQGLQRLESKTGFAGGGMMDTLSGVSEQQVTSSTSKILSNIKKAQIGAKQSAITSREGYSEG